MRRALPEAGRHGKLGDTDRATGIGEMAEQHGGLRDRLEATLAVALDCSSISNGVRHTGTHTRRTSAEVAVGAARCRSGALQVGISRLQPPAPDRTGTRPVHFVDHVEERPEWPKP
jgi:hypothetical protein